MQKNWINGFPDRGSQKKLWKIMKLTIVLLIGFMMTLSANSYSQKTKLDINLSNTTIKGLFGYIEQNSEFVFLYRSEDFNTAKKLSIELKDASINQILDLALKDEKVIYDVYDRQVVIRKVLEPIVDTQQPQKKEIKGTVLDSKGLSLPGVSVVIKGTTSGIVTDADGKFILSVPVAAKTLVFSFVGMKTQEINIGNNSTINVILGDETVGIEEVVAVGYGTQKRSSLTASISTLPVKNLTNLATGNITNSMAGQIAGVLVAQSSGEVGGDAGEIHIRGIGTTGGNGPLIIVDGVQRGFDRLDPNTIKSFTVLKDAAAVAPYGLAGANGVILVTTKRGETGAPTLSYNGYVGWQNPTKLPELTNSYQYTTMRNIADKAAGNPIAFTDADIAGYKKTVDGASDADTDKYPNTLIRQFLFKGK